MTNFHSLKNNYMKLSDTELLSRTTSYWGVTYTRYEWLLEILAHVYHHRDNYMLCLFTVTIKTPKF